MNNINNVLVKTLSLFALAVAGWLPLTVHAAANDFDVTYGCAGCHGARASLANPANGASYTGANAVRGANNGNYIARVIDWNGMTSTKTAAVINGIASDIAGVGTAASITSAASSSGTVGSAYSFTMTATGKPTLVGDRNTDFLTSTNDYNFLGQPAYTASNGAAFGATTAAFRTSIALPAGLTLNARTGAITGTPTAAGTWSGSFWAYNNIGSTSIQAHTITIAKGNQSISYTSSAPTQATVGGATYTPTATATSGLSVTLQIWSGSSAVCTMSAGVVTFIGAGTCWIQGDQAGNANWNVTGPTYQSVTVKNAQTASFTSSSFTGYAYVGGPTYTPTATTTSGGAVTFTVYPGYESYCSITSNVVTFLAVGSCWVVINQAGDSNYWPLASNTYYQLSTVKTYQSITFNAQSGQTYSSGGTFSVSPVATASSGLAVTYSSTTTGVCTIVGTTVTIVTAGTCTIAANQAGDGSYIIAGQATRNITIAKATQTITFGANPGPKTYGNAPFAVSATTPSTSSVVFTSTTTGVCTVAGSTVTIVTAGTCTIAANAATDTNYLVATQVTQNITINKATQTITFGAQGGQTYSSGGTFSVSPVATTPSTSSIVYSSTTTGVCTIVGTTITIVTAGTCTIAANAATDTNYLVATQVTANIAIAKATQTITFGAQSGQTYSSGGTFSVSPVATTPSTSSIVYSSTTTGVCTIVGTTITIVTAGTCTIAANAATDTNYLVAAQVTQNITINKATQTITFGAQAGQTYAPSTAFALSPVATTPSSSSIVYTSTTTGVCTIIGTTVTIVTAGTCTIAANAAADTNYNIAAQVTANIAIAKATQTIAFGANPGPKTYGNAPFAVSATTPSTSSVVFTSTTTGVCTIVGTTVTIVTAGTCTIAANAATDTNYLVAAQVTQNITIAKATQTISFGANPGPKTFGDAAFAVSATTPSTSPVVYTSTTLGVCTIAGSTVTIVTAGTCTIAANAAADTNYNVAAQATQNITINQATQTITFGAQGGQTYSSGGTFSISPVATTTSGLTIAYTSTTLGVCTVSGTTVTIVTAGTCTIAANQAGNTNYSAASQQTANIAIAKATQTISFGANPGPKTFGDAAFAVSATTPSSSPVVYTSTTTGVCTVAGSTVTIVTAGTCTIAANAAADTNYNVAAQVTQNITINKATQTITFGAQGGQTYSSGGTFSVSPVATTPSSSSVVYTSTTTGVCTIVGTTITIVTAGTCTIAANAATDTNYLVAAQVTANIAIAKATQTISFGANPGPKTFGDAAFAVSATTPSTSPVVYTSTTLGVCTIAGSTVTIVTAGTCTIAANAAADTNYNVAAQATQNITINKTTQTITFGANPGPKTFGDAAFAVSATTPSSSPVVYTSTTLGVCTVAGSTVTIVTAGTCTIAANAAADTNYLVAVQVTQNITVNQASQVVSFTSSIPGSPVVTGTYTPTATSTSGLSVTITIDVTSAAICSISAGLVTFNANGTCLVNANQAGNGNYAAATQQQQSIVVGLSSQTITFGANPGPKNFGDAAFAVSATASSGLTVTFTSTTTGVCTIAGSTVTIVTAGTCTIAGNQAGNGAYSPAPQATQNITINKIAQTITFGANPGPKTFGNAPFAVSAGTTSSSPVTFTSTTLGVCTVAGSTVTIVTAGTCTIAANAVTDTNYLVAAQVTQNITINKTTQTITFGANPGPKTFGDAAFAVSATTPSSSPVVFTSTTTGVCTIAGSTVTIVTAGTCTIAANAATDTNYLVAAQVTQNITINKATQTITFGAQASQTYSSGGTFAVSPVATTPSSSSVVYTSTTLGVCTIAGSTVTIVTAGTCTIAANAATDTNYLVAAQVTQNITINKAVQTITFGANPGPKTIGDAPFAEGASTTSSSPVVFTSTTLSVCTVSGSTVTIVTSGTCTIAANAAADTNYLVAVQVTQSVTINAIQSQAITVTTLAPPFAAVSSTFPVAATASSGLSVAITTSGGCSGSGTSSATITMNSATTCVVSFNQAGNISYSAAPQVTNNTNTPVTVLPLDGSFKGASFLIDMLPQ